MEFKANEAKTWLEDENGKQVAVLDHPEVRPGVVNQVHTEVDPSLGGQGIAGKITQAVADSLREKGLKAELSCSYSIKWCWLDLRAGCGDDKGGDSRPLG